MLYGALRVLVCVFMHFMIILRSSADVRGGVDDVSNSSRLCFVVTWQRCVFVRCKVSKSIGCGGDAGDDGGCGSSCRVNSARRRQVPNTARAAVSAVACRVRQCPARVEGRCECESRGHLIGSIRKKRRSRKNYARCAGYVYRGYARCAECIARGTQGGGGCAG